MAITVIQTALSFVVAGTLNAASFGSNVGAGRHVIAVTSSNDISANTSSIDTPPLSLFVSRDGSAGATSVQIWEKRTDGTEGNTFSFAQGAGKNGECILYEVAGLSAVANTIGDRSATAGPATTTNSTSGTTAATQLPDEFAVAAFGMANTHGGFVSATNGFSNDDPTSLLNQRLIPVSKILSAVGAQSTTVTWTTSRVPACAIATFKGPSLDYPFYPLITPS